MAEAKRKVSPLDAVKNLLKIAWSGSLLRVLNSAFDLPMNPEEQAAIPLAGGIMQHGYQCGMIWGSTLAAGAQVYRTFGPGLQTEARAIIAAQGLVETFRAHNSTTSCLDITGIDKSSSPMQMTIYFFIKGGTIRCMRMAARYAPAAFDKINIALSGKHIEALSAPLSCAAMLAQKMGASDMHTAMVAGFAGGIGLSGGACGALGAAIWLAGMKIMKGGAEKVDFKDRRVADVISGFVKCTGYEFECSKIVGRKFKSVGDHARYLQDGGCSKIIEALAAG